VIEMNRLFIIGFLVLILGVILIFLSVLSMGLSAISSGNVTGGFAGIIIIGPIPIIIGGGSRELVNLGIIAGIILMALSLIMIYVLRKMF